MADNDYLRTDLHDEYAKRMEEEHRRINHRLANVEVAVEENRQLVLSVEKLAISMQNMAEEQKEQGERLVTLEKRDGENWRKLVSHIATTIVGIVIGYIFVQIGM